MKIVFMGTPDFAVPILKMLHEKHHVLLVVTQPDKEVGRNKIKMPSQVKKFALEQKLNVFQPEKLMDDYQTIIDLNPDYIITAAYGQMLPKILLDRIEAINVHGSLLPKYRGGAPIQYALFNGDKTTGVTIMYMAFKMDSGDIIKQQEIDILENDTYLSLSDRLSIVGAKLLDQVLTDISHKIIERYPQDINQVTFAYTLKRSDEYINFNQTNDEIINRLKGLSPEPVGYSIINSNQIKIYQVRKSDIILENHLIPGTIIQARKQLIVKTKDGALEILNLQAPGKKQMDAKSFLNGQTIFKPLDCFLERDESL